MKRKIKNCFLYKIFLLILLLKASICEKEIDLNDEQTYSFNYIDKNIENNELNIYYFTLPKTAKLKFGLSSSSSSDSDQIGIIIYKINNGNKITIFDNHVEINHVLSQELESSEDNPIKYYIEYTFTKLHNMLFTLSYIESNNREEIYTITPTKNNNFMYYEYYSLEDFTIFFRILLYSYNKSTKIPIIITGDLVEEQINYIETNDAQETPDNIIQNVGNSNNYLEEKRVIDSNKKKIVLYYSKKENYNILNFKLRVNRDKRGLHYIGVSFVYKETVLNNFGKKYMKNSGLFCSLPLYTINKNANNTLIAYTNVTSILKIYEVSWTDEPNFIFGKTDNTYVKIHNIDTNKISLINISKEIVGMDNILFFVAENSNEDFMFQFFYIENNNIKYHKYTNRFENINFIRELDNAEYEKEKDYLLVNEYENSGDKFIYFNDIIYGDFKYKTINLDTEIYHNFINNDNLYNPHLINSGAEINIFKIQDEQILYGYNEYKIKCNDYNNTNLMKGDFIFICLEDNEITELNMPVKIDYGEDIKIKISLLFYNNTKYSFHVGINSINNIFKHDIYNSEFEIIDNWNNTLYGNKIIITNYNQIPILLYLKINAEKKYIQELENSQKQTKLQKNMVYALLFPNNSKESKIYGVYQELFSLNKLNNICIYHEFNDQEIISYPPSSSCNPKIEDNSKELNITNYGIYSNYLHNKFFTYIFYTGDEDIYLNYKHIVISDEILSHKAIYELEESKNIIYYIINNNYLIGSLLFLQLIKEDKNELSTVFIQSQGNNILNTDLFYYNHIDIFNSYNYYGEIFSIQNINSNLVFKFYERKKSLFYYEIGSFLTYNYNYDESLKIELIESSKYKLIFKPFEKDGIANYVLYVFNPVSEYNFERLSNIYYIYNFHFSDYIKNIVFENIQSSNDDFSDDIKNNFIIDLDEDFQNVNHNFLLVGNKNNPTTKKFYTPIHISSLKIKFSKIMNTFCLNPNLNNENKLKINLINDISSSGHGNLIIQWMNDSKNDTSKIKIYKGKEEENQIIYESLYDEHSYLLNINLVEENFDLIYILTDNKNIGNKICLQYISSLGADDYNNSEIEYKFFTSISLPYYIKSKTSLEIFKFKYNTDIINNIKLISSYYKNDEILLNEIYNKDNIKYVDSDYYFGIYNSYKNFLISLKINITINMLDFNSELESFKIEWIKSNAYKPNNTYNISIYKNPNFYYIDLNEFKGKNKALLLFTFINDKNSFHIYKGNYFNDQSKVIDQPFFSFDLDQLERRDDNNLIIFITFGEEDFTNGFIDISLLNGKFVTNERCDRFNMYNKIIKLSNNEEIYNICYYSKDKNMKGKLFYSIEPKIDEKYLQLFYLNNFIDSKNNIEKIILNLNKNVISEDYNNLFFGEIEIFKYKYDSNEITNLNLEFYENLEINKTILFEEIEKNFFCDIFSLSKSKKLIFFMKNYSKANGLIIIQWINNSTNNNTKIKIFKGKEEFNNIIYNSSYDDHFYLLNTSIIEDIFDISFLVNNNINLDNKICLQYISSLGKNDYDNSEIEFKYITSLNLPYYIDNYEIQSKFEIFRFGYDKANINNMKINIRYFDNNKCILFDKNYTQNDLKENGDLYFYLGIFSLTNKKYIHITTFIETDIDFSVDLNYFKIKRIKCKEIEENKEGNYIDINNNTNFYFFDLNNKNKTSLLIYTKLYNKKGFNFYMGNFFMSNSTKLNKQLYSFDLDEIIHDLEKKDNILTFMTFSEDVNIHELIDISLIEDKFILNQDCNRTQMYNKEIDIKKGTDEIYYLCYYKNRNNIKGEFKYEIRDNLNVLISVNYLNEIINKTYISEIISDLEENNIKENETVLFFGEIELFKYKYNTEKDFKLLFEFVESEIQKESWELGIDQKPQIFEKMLKKGKKYILNIIKKDSNDNGFLIIQWINNSTNNNQELKIYKGKEEENNLLYNSSYNEHSYLLNISLVNDNFEIAYIVTDNINIENKICLQYISSSGKANSEIEYIFFSSLNLPYYINNNEEQINNEILQFNYNRNTIGNLKMTLYSLDNKDYKLEDTYSQKDFKDIGDNSLYLGLNSYYKHSYININIKYQNNLTFAQEETFFIKKIHLNSLSLEYHTKLINNQSQFYLINLTKILKNEETLLLYSNLLNEGLSIYENNFFIPKYSPKKLNKPLNIFKSTDTISLILYSKQESKGFLDFKIFNNISSIKLEENCNIEKSFNKTYSFIKENNYLICYNSNKTNSKYYLTYKTNNSNNKIKSYYTDRILSKNSIEEILNELSYIKLDKDEKLIIKSDFNISLLKYEEKKEKENEEINYITFIIMKYFDIEDESFYENGSDHGGLISGILFLVANLVLIGVFWMRTKNKKGNESYSSNDSINNSLSSDNDKDSKKVSFLNNSN